MAFWRWTQHPDEVGPPTPTPADFAESRELHRLLAVGEELTPQQRARLDQIDAAVQARLAFVDAELAKTPAERMADFERATQPPGWMWVVAGAAVLWFVGALVVRLWAG